MSTSIASSLVASLVTPDTFISGIIAQCRVNSKRVALKPGAVMSSMPSSYRMTTELSWPGVGETSTLSDDVPILTIAGMPATRYSAYVDALTGYTLAEMMVSKPELATHRNDNGLIRLVGLTVAARAGTWGAVGATPVGSQVVFNPALRWSTRLNTIVVRPLSECPDTALWRHFLATQSGTQEALRESMVTVAGVGPLLFLLGGSLYHRSGEVYAMHYLEKELRAFMRSRLTREASATLALDHQSTWDTLVAAAIGGFRVSIIKQVCEDLAFITQAQIIIANDDQASLAARLDRLITQAVKVYSGASSAKVASKISHAGPREIQDNATVVDTEVGDDADDVANLADLQDLDENPGAATPKAEQVFMTAEHANTIRLQAKLMREQAPVQISEHMAFDRDETAAF